MTKGTDSTNVDKIIDKLKNNRLLAALIVIAVVVIGFGTFTGSILAIHSFWEKYISPNSPYIFKYQDQEIKYLGGNGTSLELAVRIDGARTIDAGIKAEDYWIRKYYPKPQRENSRLNCTQQR